MSSPPKPIHVSRLLPGLDFGLLLIVLMCGTAGLQWLTASSAATTGEHTLLPVPIEDLADQLRVTQRKFEPLRQELEQRQELAAGLRKQLAEAEANRPDTDSTRANRGLAEQDLEKLRQKTEGLDKELQQLQQEERDLQERKKSLGKAREDLAAQNKAIADLKNTLDQLKGENESLPEQISQLENMPLNRSSIVVNFTPEFKYETNRSPVNVALTESTVTPIREPYYEFSGLGTAILVSRVRKGAPADQAILAGSDFSKLLDGIDPQKQYIYLHVESSSYTTFLAVRDELEKRKLPWGWEPWEGLTTLVSSPGGGTPSGTTE